MTPRQSEDAAVSSPATDLSASLAPGVLFRVFSSPALEDAYQRRHLPDDLTGVRTMIAIAVVVVLLLLRVDYALFGLSRQFFELLLARSLVVAASLATFWILRGSAQAEPARVRGLVSAWAVMLAALNVYASFTRPPDLLTYTVVVVVQVMAYYALLPPGLLVQALPAAALTAGLAGLAFWANPPSDARAPPIVVGMTLIANVVGLSASRSLDLARRVQFLALRREAQLRESLAEALLKTLRGVVAICAHCKHVRDEAGAWRTVEVYVRDRSYAEFSHSICPDCLQRHYPEVAPPPARR